jgi:excisionase family DNA binding protein
MSASDEILTKQEVAQLLDCELSTIEEKARTRELPGVKIGRSWIFPRQALLQRLNEIALAKPDAPKPTGVIMQPKGRRAPPALPPLPVD